MPSMLLGAIQRRIQRRYDDALFVWCFQHTRLEGLPLPRQALGVALVLM